MEGGQSFGEVLSRLRVRPRGGGPRRRFRPRPAFHRAGATGLRIYRVRWNGNFIVEAAFSSGTPDSRIEDARALLGEAGRSVHPDDLADYKRATQEPGGLPEWVRRFFGGRR
jgi:hypothetical protein